MDKLPDDNQIFNEMTEEEIDEAFGDIFSSNYAVLMAKCSCAKTWDYCV